MLVSSVVIPAVAVHTATIIFLHGLGDTGPLSNFAGEEMHSWFNGRNDLNGTKRATNLISKIIEDEIKAGIPASRILLGGFSQGASLALYTGLTGAHHLAGVVVLSGYLPIRNTIDWTRIQKPAILQCHGDEDDVVNHAWPKFISNLMAKHNVTNYTFKSYKGLGHSTNEQEMRDVAKFVGERLKPVAPRV